MGTGRGSLHDAFELSSAPASQAPQVAGGDAEASGARPPSRKGLRALGVWVDPAVHRELRILTLDQGRSGEALLREAIGDLFEKYGRPRLV